MADDTAVARVAYLSFLTEQFNRRWPYGALRSSEPNERNAFDNAKSKIAVLTRSIEQELEVH